MAQKRAASKVESLLPQTPAGLGNVDQIREILFGGQMREYAKRFTQLEERFSQDLEHMGRDLEGRIAGVEKFARSELERLSEKLQQEREARLSGYQELEQQLGKLNQQLSYQIGRLDGSTSEEFTRIREELQDSVSQLQDRLRSQQEELQTKLARETGQLQTDKVDQADLADAFNELGMRMRGDVKTPNPSGD